MGCHGNHAFTHSQNNLGGMNGQPNEQFDTHENLSWGSKLGQIRPHGISNIIYFPVFSDFS